MVLPLALEVHQILPKQESDPQWYTHMYMSKFIIKLLREMTEHQKIQHCEPHITTCTNMHKMTQSHPHNSSPLTAPHSFALEHLYDFHSHQASLLPTNWHYL